MSAEKAIRDAQTCGKPGCECQWAKGKVHCPVHADVTPSLAVSTGKDGKLLVKDFAGCEQDAVIAVLKERGLWPAAPLGNGRNADGALASRQETPARVRAGAVAALAAFLAHPRRRWTPTRRRGRR